MPARPRDDTPSRGRGDSGDYTPPAENDDGPSSGRRATRSTPPTFDDKPSRGGSRGAPSGSPDGAPTSRGPSSRGRTAPAPEIGGADRGDDSGGDDGGIPVIRAQRRASFPRLTDARPERDGDGPSARRRAANEIEESATRRRAPAADAELPKRPIDRKSILERYDRARGEQDQRGRTAPDGGAPGQRIKSAREKARDAESLERRVKNARELDRHDAERIKNARERALESTRSLRELAYRYPERARKYEQAGRSISYGKDVSCHTGFGSTIGCTTGWWWFNWTPGFWYGNGYEDCGFNWAWWWNGCHPWSTYGWWGHPYNYTCGYAWGWWPTTYGNWWCNPNWYSGPTYYTTVVERYYEPEPAAAPVAGSQSEPAAEGEGVISAPAEPARTEGSKNDRALLDSLLAPVSKTEMARASEEYLVLGDNAFAERRYGDAVHFYAKAVEFSPDDGMLYLILSDALFATGDYHYAAYALRRALELDSTLASLSVDKHDFYKSDRLEFDRQLAVLELYLQDQPNDDDARLVLAANNLFGARPAAAVELLDRPESQKVRQEPTARLIYDAAKVLQFGKSDAPAGK
ncbi:MAG: hypothetical protein K8S98_03535 [Planctomycetes bacterium]|nr:hypothetical protein [Planctomycetota bacterium]